MSIFFILSMASMTLPDLLASLSVVRDGSDL